MIIGTNRMCISRDDNCVNTMCCPRQLPTNCKKTLYDDLISLLSSTCVIRAVLSVGYLSVSYFVVNFLRSIFAVCHSFRIMYHSGRKGFERCFKGVVLKAGMPETRNAGNQDPEILKPGMTNIFQACR